MTKEDKRMTPKAVLPGEKDVFVESGKLQHTIQIEMVVEINNETVGIDALEDAVSSLLSHSTASEAIADGLFNTFGEDAEMMHWDVMSQSPKALEDPWGEDSVYLLTDWLLEVNDGDTRLGYLDWVQHQREILEDS